VVEGDAGDSDRAAAARDLWALRDGYSAEPPLDEDEITATLAGMSGLLSEIYEAEKAAVQRLEAVMSSRPGS
jgi:hypothetical protein